MRVCIFLVASVAQGYPTEQKHVGRVASVTADPRFVVVLFALRWSVEILGAVPPFRVE